MTALPLLIGRVTRSSTLGYTGAVRLPEPDVPVFGSYCQAEAQRGRSMVIGLIYNLSIEDDTFARQVATAESLTPEQLADTQINRQVPVEFSALTIGYREADEYYYSLPPQPPMTLAPVQTLPLEAVRAFSRRLDFLPLILNAPEIPTDELVAAALRLAAVARPETERRPFLVEAGRECARLLAHDLTRLENLLRNLRL